MKKLKFLVAVLLSMLLLVALMTTATAETNDEPIRVDGVEVVSTNAAKVQLATPVANEAEETAAEETTVVTEFFTWATLATYAGAVLFATLVTQFVKKIKWLQAVPTQVICYIVAVIGLLAGTYFSGALTANTIALCFVNGLVVTVAANGTYDNIAFTSLASLFQPLLSAEQSTDETS